jgi:two-component system, NarL family, sensor kinase
MGKTTLILFFVLAALIFIAFITGLFLFIFQYRKKIILHEKEKQLLALNSILKGQDEERNRMAKDLHDGVGSMLSGIKLSLSALSSNLQMAENEKRVFNKSFTQLDSAITELRRVAHNMMPEALLKFGLKEAIQDYCDDINETNTVKIKYAFIGNLPGNDKNLDLILYRIIQELTSNIIKHAAAKNILIQVNRHAKGITLVVEDDGKGFNPAEKAKGAGLSNIQSRVDYLKGSCEIQSEAGSGTSVTVEIPLVNEP